MKTLKGTKTEVNLLTAFAGESQARNRYTFFASAAKKEGFVEISKVFEETAAQEKEHAERLFKFLQGGEVEISAAFPAGVIAETSANLAAAAGGEDHEWQEMYPGFAKIAREEGFEEIACVMEHIAIAEKEHSRRFLGFKANIDAGKVFKKDAPANWRCLNCGYVSANAAEAPAKCPACAHAQAYFALLEENW